MTETLIAVEGLDGAGKSTQVALLAGALAAAEVVSFPRYDTFFGRHIRDLLDATSEAGAAARRQRWRRNASCARTTCR